MHGVSESDRADVLRIDIDEEERRPGALDLDRQQDGVVASPGPGLERAGVLLDRRGPEECRERQVRPAEPRFDARDDHRRLERVSAGREVVVGDAEVVQIQDLAPDRRELTLELGPWGNPSPSRPAFRRDLLDAKPFGEADTLKLAGRAERDVRDDGDAARNLVVGQLLCRERLDLLLGDRGAVARHDGHAHLLTEPRVRDGKGDGSLDVGMREEDLFHLERRHLLAAAVDELLQPSAEVEIPVPVQRAFVPGSEPAVAEGRLVRLRVPLIPREDGRAPDGHLAGAADRPVAAVIVEDGDLDARRAADRTAATLEGRERVRRHLVAGLGHPIRLDDGAPEGGLETVEHRSGQCGRRRADESEGSPIRDVPMRAGTGQDPLVDGRHGRVPRRIELIDQAEEGRRVERPRRNDAAPRDQRGEKTGDDAVDVEERHHRHAAIPAV